MSSDVNVKYIPIEQNAVQSIPTIQLQNARIISSDSSKTIKELATAGTPDHAKLMNFFNECDILARKMLKDLNPEIQIKK